MRSDFPFLGIGIREIIPVAETKPYLEQPERTAVKKSKHDQKLTIQSLILIFLGRPPKTMEQCRLAFQTAKHEYIRLPFLRFLITRIWVFTFTPIWQKIYFRWVELCEKQEEIKDAFFSASYTFECWNPLKNAAAKKWLTFMADWRNEYHRHVVWTLSTNNGWIQVGSIGYAAAFEKRVQFAEKAIEETKSYEEAQIACSLADGTHLQKAAHENWRIWYRIMEENLMRNLHEKK